MPVLLARNIVNLDMVNKKIEDYQASAHHKPAKKWLASNFRKWFINNGSVHKLRGNEARMYVAEGAKDQPWLTKAYEKGEDLFLLRIDSLDREITHVIDYFNSLPPTQNLSRVSVPDAIVAARKWTEQLIKKASDEEDEEGITTIKEYDDGFRWVAVKSPQALGREGRLMKHCVGSYAQEVKMKRCSIYSLRDKYNKPHCTIETRKRDIIQIKGKSNGVIVVRYTKYVKDFVLKPPIKGIKKFNNFSDLENIGLIFKDGKIYDINHLPDNFTLDKSMQVDENFVFPKNLKIASNLSITSNNIVVPDDLRGTQLGYLTIRATGTVNIGKIDMKRVTIRSAGEVNIAKAARIGVLVIHNAMINNLPFSPITNIDSSTIIQWSGKQSDSITLDNCKTPSSFPLGLNVEDLYLHQIDTLHTLAGIQFSSINTDNKNLKLPQTIFTNVNVQTKDQLPNIVKADRLHIEEADDLDNISIDTALLDISNTNITHLGPNIKARDINISNNLVNNTGRWLKIKIDKYTAMTTLPNKSIIDGMLDLVHTKIPSLPDLIIVKEYLYLNELISEIPPTIIAKAIVFPPNTIATLKLPSIINTERLVIRDWKNPSDISLRSNKEETLITLQNINKTNWNNCTLKADTVEVDECNFSSPINLVCQNLNLINSRITLKSLNTNDVYVFIRQDSTLSIPKLSVDELRITASNNPLITHKLQAKNLVLFMSSLTKIPDEWYFENLTIMYDNVKSWPKHLTTLNTVFIEGDLSKPIYLPQKLHVTDKLDLRNCHDYEGNPIRSEDDLKEITCSGSISIAYKG